MKIVCSIFFLLFILLTWLGAQDRCVDLTAKYPRGQCPNFRLSILLFSPQRNQLASKLKGRSIDLTLLGASPPLHATKIATAISIRLETTLGFKQHLNQRLLASPPMSTYPYSSQASSRWIHLSLTLFPVPSLLLSVCFSTRFLHTSTFTYLLIRPSLFYITYINYSSPSFLIPMSKSSKGQPPVCGQRMRSGAAWLIYAYR